MRTDLERLRDVLEAIRRIQQRTRAGRTSLDDELVQVWVVHHLEILGEAVRGLSTAFRERHPDVPWREAIGQRNVIAHGYFGVDLDQVWTTVERDLPSLKARIEPLLTSSESGDEVP